MMASNHVSNTSSDSRSNPRLTNKDIDTALADMLEIYTRLTDLVNRRSEWTRADVGIACYLFFFMVEVAWTLLVHSALDRSPVTYNKQHTTPSSFKTELCKSSKVQAKLPKPIKDSAMPAAARIELTRLMTEWSPYYHDDDMQVVYNPVSYWLMALRAARDIGTHRTLAHVQSAPVTAANVAPPTLGTEINATANAGTAFTIKLPANPAIDFSDYDAGMQCAVIGDDLLHPFLPTNNRGYYMVPVARMAEDMLRVATALHKGLEQVITLCKPPL